MLQVVHSITVQIISGGKVLPTIIHQGQNYIPVPESGEYKIRLHNPSNQRKLVVLSVDGINVVEGKDAGYNGNGYVIPAWGTADIPGWRRSENEVAAFEFSEQKASYAAKTGRGTSNVGVIGVAVFDEKVNKALQGILRSQGMGGPFNGNGGEEYSGTIRYRSGATLNATFSVSHEENDSDDGGNLKGYTHDGHQVMNMVNNEAVTKGVPESASVFNSHVAQPVLDVGTTYGKAATFHTTDVDFVRASQTPTAVIVLRYATKARLQSWGVPVLPDAATSAVAFPAAPVTPSVPAPPGWNG